VVGWGYFGGRCGTCGRFWGLEGVFALRLPKKAELFYHVA